MSNENNLSYLASEDFSQKINSIIDEIVNFDQEKEAFELVDLIKKIFAKNDKLEDSYPNIYEWLCGVSIKAQFIALPYLSKNDLLSLFNNNFNIIFDLPDYILEDKIKKWLIETKDLVERDNVKKEIINILLKSDIVITGKNVIIDNIKHRGTVGIWLKDFNIMLGNDSTNNLHFAQYFADSANIKLLDESEKQKLMILFKFYEKLKISSTLLTGIEESFVAVLPNGEINIFEGGKLKKINSEVLEIYNQIKENHSEGNKNNDKVIEFASTPEIRNLIEISEQFPVGSLERRAVDEEIKKLSSQ